MSSLYLIRHGQASFGSANYDRLSELGIQQSRLLGMYASSRGLKFNAVFAGDLERQQNTFRYFSEEYANELPELQIHSAFNEHQVTEIFNQLLPTYLQDYPDLVQLIQENGRKHPAARKGIMRLFFKTNTAWVKGEIDSGIHESWQTFKARVLTAFEPLNQALETYDSVAVFSSGGTISVLLGEILGIADTTMAELNWQIRNSSISELSYSKGKYYLREFNNISHLTNPGMVSYT